MITDEDIRKANTKAAKRLSEEPHIVKAHYDSKLGRIILSLSSGAWFAFRPEDAQGLEDATPAQLKKIEITPSKFAIGFPLLDEWFSLEGMLKGRFGTRNWMAQRMGAAGGAARTEAKAAAARANGKLGGRPKKNVAV